MVFHPGRLPSPEIYDYRRYQFFVFLLIIRSSFSMRKLSAFQSGDSTRVGSNFRLTRRATSRLLSIVIWPIGEAIPAVPHWSSFSFSPALAFSVMARRVFCISEGFRAERSAMPCLSTSVFSAKRGCSESTSGRRRRAKSEKNATEGRGLTQRPRYFRQ